MPLAQPVINSIFRGQSQRPKPGFWGREAGFLERRPEGPAEEGLSRCGETPGAPVEAAWGCGLTAESRDRSAWSQNWTSWPAGLPLFSQS
jgi:hypothetical protein